MQRARRTAELAGFADPQVTPLLQEADYGRYEGLTSQQIHQQDPGWELYKDGSPGGGAAWIHADITVATGLWLDVATLCILRDGERGQVIALWNAS